MKQVVNRFYQFLDDIHDYHKGDYELKVIQNLIEETYEVKIIDFTEEIEYFNVPIGKWIAEIEVLEQPKMKSLEEVEKYLNDMIDDLYRQIEEQAKALAEEVA